jgi:hypothetical protein
MEKRDATAGEPDAEATPQQPDVALNAAVQARIGRELRAVFDEVVNEPVPDRFHQLLAALEAKQAGQS